MVESLFAWFPRLLVRACSIRHFNPLSIKFNFDQHSKKSLSDQNFINAVSSGTSILV